MSQKSILRQKHLKPRFLCLWGLLQLLPTDLPMRTQNDARIGQQLTMASLCACLRGQLLVQSALPKMSSWAIENGVDGVIISNHGGRQLDGQPATLDALRDCAPVARGKIPLAIDGGIQSGADIFKAIALGASMCFVGRIPIWGLAVSSL